MPGRQPDSRGQSQDSWLPEQSSRLPSSGDFILMYLFMLLLFGIPLLYMEMMVGQWLRTDNIQLWKQLVPWLGGIGYANTLVNKGPSSGQEPSRLPPGGLRAPLSVPCAPLQPAVSTRRCASW